MLSYLQTLYLARWVVCMTGGGGSDDGVERPSSVERASSGDGSADGDEGGASLKK